MVNAEFLLTSLIVVLIPGTGVVYTVSTGLFRGWRASLAAALGCTLGIIPHLLATSLGLSLILHTSALLFQSLKWVGVLYLLYLAWVLWREENTLSLDAALPQPPDRQIILKAILLNLFNPKLTIFFLAFLPLFILPTGASPIVQMMILSTIFMAITLTVFILYGTLASVVRTYVVNSPKVVRWIQRSFAVTFAALGLKLALSK